MPTSLAFGLLRPDPDPDPDTDTGILFRGVELVPLGQRLVALLTLVERAGVPVPKEALIESHAGSKLCRNAAIAMSGRRSQSMAVMIPLRGA